MLLTYFGQTINTLYVNLIIRIPKLAVFLKMIRFDAIFPPNQFLFQEDS